MVADKMHSRGTGHATFNKTTNVGSNLIMVDFVLERWKEIQLNSHGISEFLKESEVMERSDKFKVQIDKKDGLINYDDKKETKVNVEIPYCMKLLIQELETISVATRIVTEDNISNITVFRYLQKNMNKYSIEEGLSDEEIEELEE